MRYIEYHCLVTPASHPSIQSSIHPSSQPASQPPDIKDTTAYNLSVFMCFSIHKNISSARCSSYVHSCTRNNRSSLFLAPFTFSFVTGPPTHGVGPVGGAEQQVVAIFSPPHSLFRYWPAYT